MSFQITSSKVTGTPSATGWSQVHEFKPDDPEKFAKRGHLFAVITASAPAGKEILLRLHEEYFGNLEATAFNALKNSVQKVVGEFSPKWGEVEISAIVILGDIVYSAAGGGAKVSIYRDGAIANILESGPGVTTSASGYPKERDYIILGTKSFFENVSQGIIKGSLEGPDLSTSVESLASVIHSNPNSGTIGCALVRFNKEILADIAPVASPAPLPSRPKLNPGLFFKRIAGSVKGAIPERGIYLRKKNLDEEIGPGRKTTLWVGTILLVLLFVSIGFGVKQNASKKFKASYRDTLIQARDQLAQAENLVSSDPAQARALFSESKARVEEMVAREIKDKEVEELFNRLNEKEGIIMGIYRNSPELYLDLSLLSSGFKGDKMVASGDNLYVLDLGGKKVVGVTIATKKTKLLAGPDQADGIADIVAYDDDVYGVFSDGIYLLGANKEIKVSKDWQGKILAYAYAGNIYILDEAANIIWRYIGDGGDFGSKQDWLAPGIKPDLFGSAQLIIDGSVWVLYTPFDIDKFTQGSPQVFSVKGVFPDVTSVMAIYSNEENKYLYLLDPEGARVVVLDKTGNYKSQYISDAIGGATGVVVSEKDKKIILLSGDKLYSIEINHL